MSLVSLVEWNVSLGSADVSWGEVRAIRTAAKETNILELSLLTESEVFTVKYQLHRSFSCDVIKILNSKTYKAGRLTCFVDRCCEFLSKILG